MSVAGKKYIYLLPCRFVRIKLKPGQALRGRLGLRKAEALGIPTGSVARPIRKNPRRPPAHTRPEPIWIGMRGLKVPSACVRFNQSAMLLQKQRTICIKECVIQSSGPLSDSTVLDETWALARASNKPLYAVCIAVDVLFSQFWGLGLWA